jgi:hypothetical protein
MNRITTVIAPVREILKTLGPIFSEKLGISQHMVFRSRLDLFCSNLMSHLWAMAEYPYVDWVYRDAYYRYFSSKHENYPRDSIRVSLFDRKIKEEDFQLRYSNITDYYLGFFIIRPTPPNLLGRSMISPKAFGNKNYVCCLTSSDSTVLGIPLTSHSFPSASQDGEAMTCAETCIWSVMSYFGTKYREYSPVRPSQIVDVLSNSSVERSLPSHGLTLKMISMALQKFGLSTRIYDRGSYTDKDKKFVWLLNHYIESGIPVVAEVGNKSVSHAVVLIGHTLVVKNNYTPECKTLVRKDKTCPEVSTLDTADIPREYVVIDDNHAPFRISDFSNSVSYYANPLWEDLTIRRFVVPLHCRVNLEADAARRLVDAVLADSKIGWPLEQRNVWIRFFLTSCRSYKQKIRDMIDIDANLSKLLISISLPKFVWIAELTSEELYFDNKSNGLIILDATGRERTDSVQLIIYPNRLVSFPPSGISIHSVEFGVFPQYQNNLKGEWNAWKAN